MKKSSRRWWVRTLLLVAFAAIIYGGWYAYVHFLSSARGPASADIVHKEYRFGDVNPTHLSAAKAKGIKPVDEREDIPTENLVLVKTCPQYRVAHLEHSSPYLTPAAAELLGEIGTRFQAALKERGLGRYRIVVTSVLRTGSDIKNLRTVNENAVANSPHQYATTFDITYIRYDRRSIQGEPADNEQLANILGEVLEQLRKEKHCHVKYESRQRCFHITSRM